MRFAARAASCKRGLKLDLLSVLVRGSVNWLLIVCKNNCQVMWFLGDCNPGFTMYRLLGEINTLCICKTKIIQFI